MGTPFRSLSRPDLLRLREAAERAQVARDQARQALIEAQRELDLAWQRILAQSGQEVEFVRRSTVSSVDVQASFDIRPMSQRQKIEEIVMSRNTTDEFTALQIRAELKKHFPNMSDTTARVKINAVLRSLYRLSLVWIARKGKGSIPTIYRRGNPERPNMP